MAHSPTTRPIDPLALQRPALAWAIVIVPHEEGDGYRLCPLDNVPLPTQNLVETATILMECARLCLRLHQEGDHVAVG